VEEAHVTSIPWNTPDPGALKSRIPTPALLIDLEAMEHNLARMADFFRHQTSRLRPHFKTHKCPILAHKQIQAGAIGITCAKLSEAEVLVETGISSLLIANQVVDPAKIARLAQLASQCQLIVAVDDAANLRQISEITSRLGSVIEVVIEIDVGLGRSGVQPGEAALPLAQLASGLPGVHFAGLLGYEGHTVFEIDLERRRQNVESAMTGLVKTADLLRQAGLRVEIVSAGGTGTAFLTGAYPGVTEVEAGSYIFMDAKYHKLGLPFRRALTLLATVVSVPHSRRAIIDAGMKSLTTDNGLPEIVSPANLRLLRLSEEHGTLEVDPTQSPIHVGDRVELVPSHVCTTVNLHDQYIVMRGEVVEDVWPISARGKAY
jgi:D-serine deaminase-like pyridoxal phosphate-dependent protein